ncbi:MaoC family dehydratase [Pseudomonas nicosulfuronedens]
MTSATQNMVQNVPYEELEVGQKANFQRSVSERDIQLFAEVSGDRNPVHLDADYAATTQFKERIAHGMLTGALISAAIATTLPGPGTIYLGQNLSFTRPVKLGDQLTVELEVLEKLPKNRVRIGTTVLNQDGKAVVKGEAEVMAPTEKLNIELPALPPITIG